ncbi:MAG: hypothetical protein IJM99_06220 [Firmicutes bacterium]|nr:hypothetical protein [Bacillota bacterium]
MKHITIDMVLCMLILALFLLKVTDLPEPAPHYTLEQWEQQQGELEYWQRPPYAKVSSADAVLKTLSYRNGAADCRMTAEQARQLADFITTLYPDAGDGSPQCYIILDDWADNGVPYLRIREFRDRFVYAIKTTESLKIIDRDILIAVGDTPQIIFDTADVKGRSELIVNHSLGDFTMLLHQTQPSPSEWIGNYYRFTDGGLELVYGFERTYNKAEKLWSITDGDTATTYTKKKFNALPLEDRTDPIYLELGMDYQTEPTGALKGSNLSIPQLVEALNIYADFLEANPFNQK